MSRSYEVSVFDLNVSRRTADAPFNDDAEVGDIETIEVGAERSKPNDAADARHVVHYGVSDGIAEVKSIEADDSQYSGPVVRPRHIAHILTETDRMVGESVPEVKCVKSLRDTLASGRAKYVENDPHADTYKAGETATATEGGEGQ